eukprot:479285-Amorphochlora_amoeboformis.AAC.1
MKAEDDNRPFFSLYTRAILHLLIPASRLETRAKKRKSPESKKVKKSDTKKSDLEFDGISEE